MDEISDIPAVEEQKPKRGFAAMSPERRREVASLGGKKAQESGNCPRFDSVSGSRAGKAVKNRYKLDPEKAKEYGKKGAEKRRARREDPTVGE